MIFEILMKFLTPVFKFSINKNKWIPGLFFLIGIINNSNAQNASSPYSRFGIGDLQYNGFTEIQGMGGASIAVHEPFSINFANPASYSDLKLTSFEFGGYSNFTKYESQNFAPNTTNTTNIGYVALGFPIIANKWGASFGIMPYSNVGYKISNSDSIPGANASANYLYTGSGGINQLYFGNAVKLFKNLSIGVNASYLFGSVVRQNTVETDLGGAYNTRITNSISVNYFYFNFGLSYTFDSIKMDSCKFYNNPNKLLTSTKSNGGLDELLVSSDKDSIKIDNKNINIIFNNCEGLEFTTADNKYYFINYTKGKLHVDTLKQIVEKHKVKSDRSFTIGFTGSLNSDVKGQQNYLVERYTSISGVIGPHDTIQNNNTSGNIVLPLSIGAGLAYRIGYKLLLDADFSMQDWSKFTSFGENDQLSNSMKLAVGGQYTPNLFVRKNYLKNISYRFGAYYSKTFLNLQAIQLDDYGVSLGFGLPLHKSVSMVSLSVRAGQLGTLSNNLVREKYVVLSLGFTFNDKWFNHYKFN